MNTAKNLCAEKYGCFFCIMRSSCPVGRALPYQNIEGEVIMEGLTAKEVLNELKSRFNMELAPTESKALNKLRDWVRRGIIDGPTIRTGVDGTGGRQGLYSKELPTHLAITLYLKDNYTNYSISLEDLSKARQLAYSIKHNSNDNPFSKENLIMIAQKHGNTHMAFINAIAKYHFIWDYSLAWLLYEAKIREEVDFKTPMKLIYNIKITNDSYEYTDKLEPSEKDNHEGNIQTELDKN